MILDNKFLETELRKINLGSGYDKKDGFINIDSDQKCNPDIAIDLEKDIIPLPDGSIDYVVANHILEHIGDGFFHLMQELYRVCSDGAIIDIVVPHYTHITYIADPTHKRPITAEGLRLFSKKHNALEGSASKLGYRFDVDFEIVSAGYDIDPFYFPILEKMDDETRIRLGREGNNVAMNENIKLQVIK